MNTRLVGLACGLIACSGGSVPPVAAPSPTPMRVLPVESPAASAAASFLAELPDADLADLATREMAFGAAGIEQLAELYAASPSALMETVENPECLEREDHEFEGVSLLARGCRVRTLAGVQTITGAYESRVITAHCGLETHVRWANFRHQHAVECPANPADGGDSVQVMNGEATLSDCRLALTLLIESSGPQATSDGQCTPAFNIGYDYRGTSRETPSGGRVHEGSGTIGFATLGKVRTTTVDELMAPPAEPGQTRCPEALRGTANSGGRCTAARSRFSGWVYSLAYMSKRPATQMTLARAPRGEAPPSTTQAAEELSGRELEAARGRLVGASFVVGGIMLGYFIAYQSVWSEHESPVGFYVSSLSSVLLAAVGLYAWRSEPTRRRLIGTAVVLHSVLGVALSVMEPFNVVPTEQPYTLISWNCVNILLVPALLPAGARFVVAFSFALASLTALGFVALGDVSGASELSASVGASLWLPPFACALVVAVPAGMMSRLRQELSSARQLGAYALVECIGEGGMGEVWRATHRFLRRPAAIKVVRPEQLGHSDDARTRALTRFEREAQAIATLESPHTIKLFDFGVADDGSLFYVMELLRGIDLQQLVDELGPVPPERAVHLLLQACDSLNEAHDAGLVHRDIKPSNLFVGPRATDHDVLRVLDFGLVMHRAGDETGTSESGGQIQGTPSTIAPEAALGEEEVDGRADLYALGCVAFFLVTGRPVFEAKTPVRMIALHVTEPPIAPSSCSPHTIPADFDEVVLACLAKDPNARPSTADELGARLRNIQELAAWTPAEQQRWWQTILPNV